MVVYTEDCLLFAQNDAIIDDIIKQLSSIYDSWRPGQSQWLLGDINN